MDIAVPTPRRDHRLEKGILSVFILLGSYYASVILVRGMYGEAFSNAHALQWLEGKLGIWGFERWVATLGFPGAGALYWASEFAVVYGMVIVLVVFRREYAWSFWKVVVGVNVIGCTLFILIPMAPPWALFHLYGPGIRSAGNAIGAFPSIHQADAVIVGRYFRLAFRNRWAMFAGIAWEAIVAFDVVATGNHYLLDVLAGGLLGWLACNYVEKRKL